MDSLEFKTRRGDEAERLLNSPMLRQAFEDVRAGLANTWAALDTTDERYSEFSKDLHRKMKMLASVEMCIKEHVSTGKIAQKSIEAATKRPFSFNQLKQT